MANIQIQNKIEEILDKVAVALLTSDYYGVTQKVKQNQKTIRDGIIALNKTANEPLVVYQKTLKVIHLIYLLIQLKVVMKVPQL